MPWACQPFQRVGSQQTCWCNGSGFVSTPYERDAWEVAIIGWAEGLVPLWLRILLAFIGAGGSCQLVIGSGLGLPVCCWSGAGLGAGLHGGTWWQPCLLLAAHHCDGPHPHGATSDGRVVMRGRCCGSLCSSMAMAIGRANRAVRKLPQKRAPLSLGGPVPHLRNLFPGLLAQKCDQHRIAPFIVVRNQQCEDTIVLRAVRLEFLADSVAICLFSGRAADISDADPAGFRTALEQASGLDAGHGVGVAAQCADWIWGIEQGGRARD